MEQNSQLTPEQSLRIINETLENNRKAIIRKSGDYFILWGSILSVVSIAVYLLWSKTGSAAWNFLWFAIPAAGYPLAALINRNSEKAPNSFVSDLLGWSWGIFGAFAIIISLCAMFWAPMNLTLVIILLFGSAEAMTGATLKNLPIAIAGMLTGIVGAIAAVKLAVVSQQALLFLFAGIILILTGILVKCIKK